MPSTYLASLKGWLLVNFIPATNPLSNHGTYADGAIYTWDGFDLVQKLHKVPMKVAADESFVYFNDDAFTILPNSYRIGYEWELWQKDIEGNYTVSVPFTSSDVYIDTQNRSIVFFRNNLPVGVTASDPLAITCYRYVGPFGAPIDQGDQGPQGPPGTGEGGGSQGVQGSQGAQGTQGDVGAQGSSGSGAQGSQGAQGVDGSAGADGAAGNQGDQGSQGDFGPQGVDGVQGNQGSQGDFGPPGDPGGPQGVQGSQGTQGVQGIAGPSAVAGDLPSATALMTTPFTTTSATYVDITDLDADVTLEGTSHIWGIAYLDTFESGAGSAITTEFRIVIHTQNGDAYEVTYPTVGQRRLTTIHWRSASELVAGTYTVKVQARITAGTNTLNVDWAYLVVLGLQGAKGDQGTQGAQGVVGSQGVQGSVGPQGVDGSQGSQGSQGNKGDQGDPGPQGVDGSQGVQGSVGPQGNTGSQGDQGPCCEGAQGPQGDQGHPGNDGAQGSQGTQGDPGVAGTTGSKGDQGDQGTQGVQGSVGSQGVQGSVGPQGVDGSQGVQGSVGQQGATGSQGVQGPCCEGDQGPQGKDPIDPWIDPAEYPTWGDGTVSEDVTQAWEAAIADAIAENKGIIVRGRHVVKTGRIKVTTNKPLLIKGMGMSLTESVIETTDDSGAVIEFSTSLTTNAMVPFRLENVTIYYAGAGAPTSTSRAVLVTNTASGSNNNATIVGNWFLGFYTAVEMNNQSMAVVEKNYFYDYARYGLYLRRANSTYDGGYSRIYDNEFQSISSASGSFVSDGAGVYIEQSSGMQITKNRFKPFHVRGIYFHLNGASAGDSNATVFTLLAQNQFDSLGTYQSDARAIELYANFDVENPGIAINGNKMRWVHIIDNQTDKVHYLAKLTGADTGLHNVSVIGNQMTAGGSVWITGGIDGLHVGANSFFNTTNDAFTGPTKWLKADVVANCQNVRIDPTNFIGDGYTGGATGDGSDVAYTTYIGNFPVSKTDTPTNGQVPIYNDTTDVWEFGAPAPDTHVHDAAHVTTGTFTTARLGSGTADNTKFLRGDLAWETLVAANIPSLDTAKITTGTFTTARLGSGTADITKFLRGDLAWETLTAGDIPNLDAAKITTGTFATGRLGSGTADITKFLRGDLAWETLTAGDIPNLDAAKITTGTFTTGRLGSGTANNTKFLRGDLAWETLVAADIPNLDVAKITSGVFGTGFLGTGTANTTTWLRGDGTWVAPVVGGSGLTLTGTTLDVVSANGGIVINADNIALTLDGTTLTVGAGGLKLSNLTDGQVLIGNGSNVATARAISGDATISNTGVVTLASTILREADIVTREVPTGTIDGSNALFALASTPITGTEHVYLNGVLQEISNDYTIVNKNITFGTAPAGGSSLVVSYFK